MRYTDLYGEITAGTAEATVPLWARRVLGDIAQGRMSVAAVRHPLGFLCLPVERTGGLGVCLHIWSPEVESIPATTSGVHCHSWELVSFVLYGEVRNTRARVSDVPPTRPEGATHRVFEVMSRSGIDELRATGRTVRYASGETGTHSTGAVYALPAGVFHSTFIEGGPDAATVALGRQDEGGGNLSLGPLDTPSHQIRRMRCGPDETARAALRSARRIEAAHPALPEPRPAPEPAARPVPGRGAEAAAEGPVTDPDPPDSHRRAGRTARR